MKSEIKNIFSIFLTEPVMLRTEHTVIFSTALFTSSKSVTLIRLYLCTIYKLYGETILQTSLGVVTVSFT